MGLHFIDDVADFDSTNVGKEIAMASLGVVPPDLVMSPGTTCGGYTDVVTSGVT